MNGKTKTIFFVFGLAILFYMLYQFGFDNIVINIKRTGWWFLPITGIYLFVYLMNTIAWKLIMKAGYNRISFKDLFTISISGFAINYITPFVNLGGEPYKILALKDQLGIHRSVSSVILYSMLHILSSFVFWIGAILLVLFTLAMTSEFKIILEIVLFASLLGTLFLFTRHKKGIFRSIIKIIPKLPFSSQLNDRIKLKEESLEIIDEQITDLFNNKKNIFYSTLFLEVGARVVASLEFIFILRSVGIYISMVEAIYINAFLSLVINILFFMPMTLGVREGSLYFIMEILKFTSGVGVYIALVTRIRELFWISVGLLLIQLRKHKPAADKNIDNLSVEWESVNKQ
ncbi:MAG: transmembrane protein [Stygiobacter sp.]|nr:MAG: transmembrane protein [Stygiobacter sp.]KAF0218031.1 MAG: transmembrane [Ignavibacteria bacterium]